MTKCKHCGEEIYKTNICWYHKVRGGSHYLYCKGAPKAEPLIEWVTPTTGPVLPEVEVRDHDDQEWTKASLIRVDHSCCMPYFVNVVRVALWFKQCRMKKESVNEQ
jgi:hypothetical protein